MAKLEMRRIVIGQHLLINSFGNFTAAMAKRCTEQGR
jgi:hypothetical protein